MKNLGIGFLLGVLFSLSVALLLKQSPEHSEPSRQVASDILETGEEPTQLPATTRPGDSIELDKPTINNSTENSRRLASAAKPSTSLLDRTNAVLLEMDMRDAKRLFRKVLPRNSPKHEVLLAVAKLKLEQELQFISETSSFASIEDTFDENGKLKTPSLSADQVAELQARQEARRARSEQIRQQFEDSMRNLLTEEELNAFRQQEVANANEHLRSTIEATVDGIEESIPDLNDYQFSEIQRLAQTVPGLQQTDVPIGSQLGTFSTQTMVVDETLPIMEFYQQVEQLLSPAQLAEWRNRAIMFQTDSSTSRE